MTRSPALRSPAFHTPAARPPSRRAALALLLAGSLVTLAAGCTRWRMFDQEHATLVAALRGSSMDERVAALDRWETALHGDLPAEVVQLADDVHPETRRAALEALAKHRDPRASELLFTALDDPDVNVRATAITALADLGERQAAAQLETMLANPSEKIRVATAGALAKLNEFDALRQAAQDKAWQVRASLAAALTENPQAATLDLAKQLAGDRSAEVQKQVIARVEQWPLPWAIPVLLTAAQGETFAPSKLAAEQLVRRWEAAKSLPVDPPQDANAERLAQAKRQRDAALAELWQRWRTDFEAQVASGVERAQQTVAISQEKLAELETVVAGLTARDVSARRQSAAKLAALAPGAGLPPTVLARLAEVATAEQDGLVWQHLFTALQHETGDSAAQLALAALSHPADDVRRQACEWLAKRRDPQHAAALGQALTDSNTTVVLAAVQALAALGPAATNVPAPANGLVKLLAHSDVSLRLEAASALASLGEEAGFDALTRMAHDADPKFRRQLAARLGTLRHKQSVVLLILLLDDAAPAVQQAALAALPAATGQPASAQSSPADQIRHWKSWHAAQTSEVGAPAPVRLPPTDKGP